MYREIIYKTNKGKEVFGFLTKVGLSEPGMYSFFNIGPFHDGLLECGYLRIDGDDEFVNKVANKFEYFFKKQNEIKADLIRL